MLEVLDNENKNLLQQLAYIPKNLVKINDLFYFPPTNKENSILRFYINAQEIQQIIDTIFTT